MMEMAMDKEEQKRQIREHVENIRSGVRKELSGEKVRGSDKCDPKTIDAYDTAYKLLCSRMDSVILIGAVFDTNEEELGSNTCTSICGDMQVLIEILADTVVKAGVWEMLLAGIMRRVNKSGGIPVVVSDPHRSPDDQPPMFVVPDSKGKH